VYPIVRLTEDGVDWGAAPGPGDEIGYGMRPLRLDECLRAAVATATQIPIEQVPDLRLDDRLRRGDRSQDISRDGWSRIETWAGTKGLTLKLWPKTPAQRERWIGVCAGAGEVFGDHCLVMCHNRVVFDPACSIAPPPGTALAAYSPESIVYGLSFESEGE
jgi:hypothetical protein